MERIFVNRHTFHGAGQHSHGSAADDVDEIPNTVITEAVNNAIAHRNYANNGSIQVEVYQDRIEVISPGRLMPPLTVESLYGKHESVAPNPHIARAMFWVKYIETVGTGLNELLDACAAVGLKKPTIEANDIHFRLIIWRRENSVPNSAPSGTQNGTLNDAQALFEAIRRNPGHRIPYFVDLLGKGERTLKRYLAEELKGRVEFRGSSRTGGYYTI